MFGLAKDDVRVVYPFVGGGFGSGLRPQYQLFLAVLAALQLERSVRVVLTREQMFSHVFRPETLQVISLGASRDGELQAITHEAIGSTSRFEDHQEVVVNWSGCCTTAPTSALSYKLAPLDTYTPGDMRAPGRRSGCSRWRSRWTSWPMPPGSTRSSCGCATTASATRTRQAYTSKELRAAYQQGAERFGWSGRARRRGRCARAAS